MNTVNGKQFYICLTTPAAFQGKLNAMKILVRLDYGVFFLW